MEEERFGPIRFIRGDNRGRYPFCHSIYVEDAGILIDPASNRNYMTSLQKKHLQAIWLTHWHEDHIMHLDLFEDVPLWISARDAPPLSATEVFLQWYGFDYEDERNLFKALLKDQFHFKSRKPARFLQDGEIIQLGSITVEVIPAPGHTPGHVALFFRKPEILFMGDYDLTPFGPWYGDVYSSIEDTIASLARLKKIPAQIWLTSHDKGIFKHSPGILWEQYEGVIYEREKKLLKVLERPSTLEEIVDSWIIYGKPKEPRAFFIFGERAHMKKHLENLTKRELVCQDTNGYWKRCD